MTDDQVKTACDKYAARLSDEYAAKPVRDAEAATTRGKINHLLWMCGEVPAMMQSNPMKAMRWFGFLQGALNCMGVFTINELKEDNR